MRNLFPLKKVLILVAILALPGFLYYLLQHKGQNRYHPLAIYGPKKLSGTSHTVRRKSIPDTLYHQVSDFQLINQLGVQERFPADTTKITVVNFFFTRCPSFCTNMNREMERVVAEYQNNRLLKFISITVDPRYDTPAVLSKYAASYHAQAGKWDFLTGDESQIFSLARNSFLVDAVRDTSQAANVIHSPMLILVDPAKRIRGYYDSGSKEQVDKLIDEIKVMIVEELRKVKNPY